MDGDDSAFADRAPGVEQQESRANFLSYTVGLGLAILLTIASFVVSQTNLLWAPGVSVGLVVLAFAQIGVHLVFFLHLGSGPDHTNNILALAFGVLIVFLVIAGSVWIIANLNANMMPMPH
ncbi:MAG TPA: cytochrome o ubiquinol oxidase subunit IV [Stellaceae bacterium]|jgi:cytochrome o ubiquinol oxidase operon protein cyoD|nr:cytochrome o ubiquinol oxidase subunit IV [Stellaceae bacterium]